MYLAIKEMVRYRQRFVLIISIVVLICYLIFFLSGLANGLSKDNTSVIDTWQAKGLVLDSNANKNIFVSRIDKSVLEETFSGDRAFLTAQRSVVTLDDKDDKLNVVVLNATKDSRLIPELIEGKQPTNEKEAIVSLGLKSKYGLDLQDKLYFKDSDTKVTIVGFTSNLKLNVTDIVYIPMPLDDLPFISAVLLFDKKQTVADLEYLSIEEFIESLPGYLPQRVTFGLMISALIIIASIVLGVFMYIMTIQKKSVFAILKIQGINNRFIARSVPSQTLLINGIGMTIGLVLTLVSGTLLSGKVPFASNYAFYGLIACLMMLTSLLGAMISIRTATSVDPLDALE